MNLKIKFRESFRPFAPAVLREHADEYFELAAGHESPYMLLVAPVCSKQLLPVEDDDLQGLDKLKQIRSRIPAVTHVDRSARVQTVDRERNPRFYGILEAFMRRTGCPVVINTSFNVRGEPIVNTPADAYRCFLATEMDALVIERCVLLKRDQRNQKPIDRSEHLAQFALD